MTVDAKLVDWERIEADYRAGVLSVREIAAANGVSHTAINKRAKADGWERDLSAKVRAKADALVAKREALEAVSTERAQSERGIVEANAEVIATVRMQHRKDIGQARRHHMALQEELETFKGPLSQRIDCAKKLGDTLRTLVTLEREAYGIGELDPGKDDERQGMADRLAKARERATH